MNSMARTCRWFLAVLIGLLSVGVQAGEGKTDRKPNIIFILADDLGWTDTAAYGSRYYETPNIDRLAAQGVKFNRHHTSPNCQPTRAALMTGQYGPRTGVYTVGHINRFEWWKRSLRPVENVVELPLNRTTFAQSLKRAGYATGLFGKWHLGETGDFHPSRRGFDEAIVSMHAHFDFQTNPRVDYPKGTYLADFLTDRAVSFIERKREKPFLLCVNHFGVHSPHQAKEEWIRHFRGKPGAGGHRDPVYAAMIASLDESVGRILQCVEKEGLNNNTVVIFSSDNGGVGGYLREGIQQGSDITDNLPLRSGKGSLYEGGVRVPFVVRWPGRIRPGTVCDMATIHVDLFPTFLELSGATASGQELDGESLVRLFKNPKASLKRKAIFHHFPGYLGSGNNTWRTTPAGAIESGDWKLLEFFETGNLELYNLRLDPGEQRNLASEEPQRVKRLHAAMVEWRRRVNAPMPVPHKPGSRPAGSSQESDGATRNSTGKQGI